MVTKKFFNMDMLIDVAMTRLFQLAEYVCVKTTIKREQNQQPASPIIRFSDQDRMVEGELFKSL